MSSAVGRSFGSGMRIFLCLPLALVLGAWLTQWTIRFPAASVGASATATALLLGLVGGMVPVPIAVAKLIRNPADRTLGNVGLTLLGALVLAIGLLLAYVLLTRL